MNQQKIITPGNASLVRQNSIIVLFGLAIAFLCLLLRTSPPYYPGKYLLSEDGPIFIQQAWTFGIHSLWIPYSGYSHLYMRLVAFFCYTFGFNLIETSYIFLLGWLIAFSIMIMVIVVRAQSFKLSPFYIYWLIVLVTLQPSSGEVFFHFPDSIWPLGTALGIYLLTRNNDKPSLLELLFIILLGLSGPFSLFVAPLFLVKELIEKNLGNTYPLLITLLLCAIIQGALAVFTERMPAEHNDIFTSLMLIINVLFFNTNSLFGMTRVFFFLIAILFFWISVLVSLKTTILSDDKLSAKISPILLFLFAFISLIIAVSNGISEPKVLADRYLWLPYTVFFFTAAILSVHSKKTLICVFLSMSVICTMNFYRITLTKTYLPNRQFQSYVHFSEYKRITIPMLPQSYRFPFNFSAGETVSPESLLKLSPALKPNLYSFSNNEIKTHISNKMIIAQTKNSNSYLVFNEPIYCLTGTDIGIEIKFHKNKKGFTTLWWGDKNHFTKEQSISYVAPKGDIRVDFAFPNNKQANDIAFSPNDRVDTVEIQSLDVYCLPERKNI